MKMTGFEKLYVNSGVNSWRVARHAAGLLRHVKPERGQTYLDLGCGNGEAPILIAVAYGLRVTGVDVDPAQIAAARSAAEGLGHAEFVTGDGTHLPFDGDSFDIVASYKTTHHMSRWLEALEELVRVLRPGGYFIYNDLTWPSGLVPLVRRWARKSGFPTVPALEAFLQRHELTVLHRRRSPFHFEVVCLS